jgi:hypothetical protein
MRPGARHMRNSEWFHMVNQDIISMPDKWEYPWYAAWDLAFHAMALSTVDVEFAKEQLDLLLNQFFLHPNAQIPAYECNFSGVNPPAHALATIFLYRAEQALHGVVLGSGKVESKFEEAYRQFVSLPSARTEFGKLFLSLGDPKQLPAVFHCTTGKDRTGWAAAAMLTPLGVPKDQVYNDYLRSNDYIIPAYQKHIDAFVAAGGEKSIALAILGVKTEYLDAAFDEMQTKYGTIENYFSEGLRIDAARQKVMRDLYLRQK